MMVTTNDLNGQASLPHLIPLVETVVAGKVNNQKLNNVINELRQEVLVVGSNATVRKNFPLKCNLEKSQELPQRLAKVNIFPSKVVLEWIF